MFARTASLTTPFALAVAIVLIASTILGFPLLDLMTRFEIDLDEGIEIIRNESYEISTNLKWNKIKAAGIEVTEKSWKGFLQICERLVMDFGNARIYLDLEARVMFVYADPTASQSEKEAYYVQFG